MHWAVFIRTKVRVQVPAIRDIAKRAPEIESFTLRFLKNGSPAVMIRPNHRMGWGKSVGSPKIRSSINAAGMIYPAVDSSMSEINI
jgi:hypothetical protein